MTQGPDTGLSAVRPRTGRFLWDSGDRRGGAAGTSSSLDASRVLLAIGLPHDVAHGSPRLSLGLINTEEDVKAVVEALPPIVTRLRAMSPLTPS